MELLRREPLLRVVVVVNRHGPAAPVGDPHRPARDEHTSDFPQIGARIREILQGIHGQHQIDALVFERQGAGADVVEANRAYVLFQSLGRRVFVKVIDEGPREIAAEDILKAKGLELISVSPRTTVSDALRIMTEHRVGAIVVKDNGRLVGIWTERDLMKNTVTEGFDPHSDEVSKHMVTGLKYASYDESVYQLQDKFLGMRLRHLLIKKKRDCIGIVSTGDVMRMLLNDMKEQLDEAKTLASWQYYENWRWR